METVTESLGGVWKGKDFMPQAEPGNLRQPVSVKWSIVFLHLLFVSVSLKKSEYNSILARYGLHVFLLDAVRR